MHVIGDILVCGVNNISSNILIAQGISIPTGKKLWDFNIESIPYYVAMSELHVLVPNDNIILICGTKETRDRRYNKYPTTIRDDEEIETKYRIAFLTFHPELFEAVPEDQ